MPDRLKEIYDQYPNTYSTVTKDGKIYGMAVSPHLTEGEVMIIRQDWLDNLGLEAPTTIDEFEEVIRAFTEDDPDGNGEKDTYGFTYEGDTIYNNGWCADPVTIFSVYTGKNLPGQWQEDEDGKLVYVLLTKEIRRHWSVWQDGMQTVGPSRRQQRQVHGCDDSVYRRKGWYLYWSSVVH